jgi:hypothetical protein
MLYIIEPAIRAKILTLPFLERYGGIAHSITAKFQAGDGFNAATFPVSMSLTHSECFDRGKYINLVPDDRYKSVAYLEGLNSPARVTFSREKRAMATITQTVRFTAWLNLPKLGWATMDNVALAALGTVAMLEGEYPVTYAGQEGRLRVGDAIIYLDRNNAFGGYSYQDKQALFMWPYGFFSVGFTCTVLLPLSCLAELEIASPIECLTEW